MTARHDQMTARLMAHFGGTAMLTVPGGRDPDSPEWDPVFLPDQHVMVQAIVTGAELDLIAGGAIQASDMVVAMLPHRDVVPTPACRLTVAGISHALLDVQPVRSTPDGAVIYYRLHGRA
ncbi:hypothetical protein [uncultured Paracoccus sp.]|uniref:hypothetical protein n=1 Tax=uncultured Paracoccus sp. TaxID=189685 RepID=UPI00261598FC|nr:hypothetical protein [uncultured Paracoccus sp.]